MISIVDLMDQRGIHRMNTDDGSIQTIFESQIPYVAYAECRQADIRAFGLPSGHVRVMGGICPPLLVGQLPRSAPPRHFDFFIGSLPPLLLAFSPNGSSLACLYSTMLIVVDIHNPLSKHVYYLGVTHQDVFVKMTHTDQHVFVSTTTGTLMKFALEPTYVNNNLEYHFERIDISSNIYAISDSDEITQYSNQQIRFGTDKVATTDIAPFAIELSDYDNDFQWVFGEHGIEIYRSGDLVVRHQEVISPDSKVFVTGNMGYVLCATPAGRLLMSVYVLTGQFLIARNPVLSQTMRPLPFGIAHAINTTGPLATMLTFPRQLIQFLPVRRHEVVMNRHIFTGGQVDENESEEGDEGDDEEEGSDDDEEEEEEEEESSSFRNILNATFHYPQPLTGLQKIIQTTRRQIENLEDWDGMSTWSPDEFKAMRKNLIPEDSHSLMRLLARTTLIRSDILETIELTRADIKYFADFFEGSANMGAFETSRSARNLDEYQMNVECENGSNLSASTSTNFDDVLRYSEISRIRSRGLEGRIDIVDDLLRENASLNVQELRLSVNTGVISTLNCMITQLEDVLEEIRVYRKGVKTMIRDARIARKRLFCETSTNA